MNKVMHPQIKEMIENRRWNELRSFAREIPAPDLADILLSLDQADRILFLALCPEISLPKSLPALRHRTAMTFCAA